MLQEIIRVKDNRISWWRKVLNGVITNGDGSNPIYAGAFYESWSPVPLVLKNRHSDYVVGFDFAQDGQSIEGNLPGRVCKRH